MALSIQTIHNNLDAIRTNLSFPSPVCSSRRKELQQYSTLTTEEITEIERDGIDPWAGFAVTSNDSDAFIKYVLIYVHRVRDLSMFFYSQPPLGQAEYRTKAQVRQAWLDYIAEKNGKVEM